VAAPSFTTILLVRHGATATTGTVLPGRATGLHLSERGVIQAQAVAARIGELTKKPVAIYRLAARTRSRDGGPHRQHAEAPPGRRARDCSSAISAPGTGKKLSLLSRKGRVEERATLSEHLSFPQGESFAGCNNAWWATLERLAAQSTGSVHPRRQSRRYDQAPPSPSPRACRSNLFQRTGYLDLSVSAIGFTGSGPVVLLRQQHDVAQDLRLVNYVFQKPGPGGWSACAARSAIDSSCSRRPGAAWVIVKCEKLQLSAQSPSG